MIIQLLEKVCAALNERGITYMISGSMAMNQYTIPRMTRDIDVVINLQLNDIDSFGQIFASGFYINVEGIGEEIKRRGMFNVIDFESGQKIDFIIRKDTEFHRTELERRKMIRTHGFDMWIVTVEDLIISKLKWIQELQSDTQIGDIKNLLENKDVDKTYVRDWVKSLHLNTFDIII